MEHPEKYVCQIFTSPTETKLVYTTPGFVMPAEAPRAGIKADPTSLRGPAPAKEIESRERPTQDEEACTAPECKPEAAPAKKIESKEQPKTQRKVAARAAQPRQEQQAMLDDVNPFRVLFNW
jgi:hypothetical protein